MPKNTAIEKMRIKNLLNIDTTYSPQGKKHNIKKLNLLRDDIAKKLNQAARSTYLFNTNFESKKALLENILNQILEYKKYDDINNLLTENNLYVSNYIAANITSFEASFIESLFNYGLRFYQTDSNGQNGLHKLFKNKKCLSCTEKVKLILKYCSKYDLEKQDNDQDTPIKLLKDKYEEEKKLLNNQLNRQESDKIILNCKNFEKLITEYSNRLNEVNKHGDIIHFNEFSQLASINNTICQEITKTSHKKSKKKIDIKKIFDNLDSFVKLGGNTNDIIKNGLNIADILREKNLDESVINEFTKYGIIINDNNDITIPITDEQFELFYNIAGDNSSHNPE